MPTVSSIVKDVRALGSSAPIRAVYEVSKRTNGHALLFRSVSTRYRSHPLSLGDTIPTTEGPRVRCLEDARLIINEGTRVFGARAATGAHASWAMDPLTGQCWPEDTPWWQIDIRSDARLSDVKFVWEAARHRDLVVLARAAVIEPEGPWLDHLEKMLIRWCHECRPERGVHWYSSLELALRAIAWTQVLRLVGERLHSGLRSEMDHQLVASARHIMVELPYTLSSMKNNHLLGDGLGLVVLGKMFPQHPRAAKWRAIGDRLMIKQLQRHMLHDGSMIEDSISYHRFVLEMFVVRVLIGGAPTLVVKAMQDAARHLSAIGALDGPVPQYGDWDEGRVLADSQPAGDVAGAAHLALHLGGELPASDTWASYDELAWYAAPRVARANTAPKTRVPRPSTWASGHFSGAEHNDWRVWLKRTGTGSHQHADLSSIWVQHRGSWVLRDPGTGTYNGPLHVRNGFRTSGAHPVWRPEGSDLLGPHRAFRWERKTVPNTGHGQLEMPSRSLLAVWHDGFPTGRILRLVLVESAGVTVLDRLPVASRDWVMTVPEGPAAEQLQGVDGIRTMGQDQPFAGWLSDTYGDWHPSPWREVRSTSGWKAWGAGSVRSIISARQDRILVEEMQIRISDYPDCTVVELTLDDTTYRIEAPRE